MNTLFYRTTSPIPTFSQPILERWRQLSSPLTLSLISLPIGIPLDVGYIRKNGVLTPVNIDLLNVLNWYNGSIEEPEWSGAEKGLFRKAISRSLPQVTSEQDEVSIKMIATYPCAKIQASNEYTKYKDCNDPFNTKDLLVRLTKRVLLYVYDATIHHSLYSMESENVVTPLHDLHSILNAQIDNPSSYGIYNWAYQYRTKNLKGAPVIYGIPGKFNMWSHNRYVVCESVRSDRVATIGKEHG